jgi:hypothetical protein
MAKMRRSAAQPVDWQHGVMLPETADHMKDYNKRQERGLYGPSSVSPPWNPEDVSTAFVAHGERMHALQVNHETTISNDPYLWSIHRHYAHPDGSDPRTSYGWEHLDDGGRDHECSMCEAAPGEECGIDCWDQNSHTGGPMGTTIEDDDSRWQDGTRGEFWGWQPDRGRAQKAAETAWAKYTGENGSGLGDVDLGTIGPIVPEPGGRGPDDDYGDFSGLFGGGK